MEHRVDEPNVFHVVIFLNYNNAFFLTYSQGNGIIILSPDMD